MNCLICRESVLKIKAIVDLSHFYWHDLAYFKTRLCPSVIALLCPTIVFLCPKILKHMFPYEMLSYVSEVINMIDKSYFLKQETNALKKANFASR